MRHFMLPPLWRWCSLFWVVMHHTFLVAYRRFGTAFRLQGSGIPLNFEDGTDTLFRNGRKHLLTQAAYSPNITFVYCYPKPNFSIQLTFWNVLVHNISNHWLRVFPCTHMRIINICHTRMVKVMRYIWIGNQVKKHSAQMPPLYAAALQLSHRRLWLQLNMVQRSRVK
jgi:hypothetical protein